MRLLNKNFPNSHKLTETFSAKPSLIEINPTPEWKHLGQMSPEIFPCLTAGVGVIFCCISAED